MQSLPEFPFALTPQVLDQLFRRAQSELHIARAELHTNEAAAAAEEARHDGPHADPHEDEEPIGERLIMGHELLLAVRGPVEWLLALARRLAAANPDDVAAIDRLTAAFHSRLAGSGLGVRVADALIAFGILVGSLDPSVVLEAASKTLSDGMITVFAYEGADLAAEIVRLAEMTPSQTHQPHRVRVRGQRARSAR